jgi:hypothetical protein
VTALALNSIPSSINTYERLAVWAIQCLQNITPQQEVLVTEGQAARRLAECALVTTADGQERFMLSAYLPCSIAGINDPAQKTWMATTDVSGAEPHVNLRSN